MAFQVTQYQLWNLPPELMLSAQIGFFNVFAILVNAVLVPAIVGHLARLICVEH